MLNHVVVSTPSWWKTERVIPLSMKYTSCDTSPDRTSVTPLGTSTHRIRDVKAARALSETG